MRAAFDLDVRKTRTTSRDRQKPSKAGGDSKDSSQSLIPYKISVSFDGAYREACIAVTRPGEVGMPCRVRAGCASPGPDP